MVGVKKLTIVLFGFLLMGCVEEKILTDDDTLPVVEKVTPRDQDILVKWASDAMDRGNHDYTYQQSELVVDPDYDSLKRGDVIYYKMPESEIKKNPMIPENYLGRVVGLPGETVMIRYGHVYINHKRLDTFYGEATVFGKGEEEYFEDADLSRINDIDWLKRYFKTEMNPVVVEEDTVFVLVDQWWRGTDSKNFGLLPVDQVEGKVLGYLDLSSVETTHKNYVEHYAKIGMSKKRAEQVFGNEYISRKGNSPNSEVLVYGNVQEDTNNEEIPFEKIKDDTIEYHLKITFVFDEAKEFLYSYKSKNGQLWQYLIEVDGKKSDIKVKF